MTSSVVPVAGIEPERPAPPFAPALVDEMLKTLVKAVRAHQLYLPNNPMYARAIDALRAAFAPIWSNADSIVLVATETDFLWHGVSVLREAEKSGDSLPWLCFKDGVRELELLRGVEQEEIVGLLDIIQRVRKAAPDEDDLLTMLWEKDFLNIRYRYVDLAIESAPTVEGTPAEVRPTKAPQAAVEEELQPSRPGVVNLDEFDATLYFLDEREIEYLREGVREEYASDLRRNVLTMLLDVFELQSEQTVREEVAGILDSLMLHLLSGGQFHNVAYLLRETTATLQRARELQPAQRGRLATLPDRLSRPEALSQLLQSLDEAASLPSESDLLQLFEQLRGSALGTVFAWLSRTQNPLLRTMLENAAGRLASSNTAELVRLIGMADVSVAREAIRRAGALKTAAAVAPLSKVLADGEAAMRLAAVQALAEIASPGALQTLERGVEDSDRAVRIATARALGARTHRPALVRLESVVKGKAVREADPTEKMAFFEAYGTLCGDGGVALLDEILNGKGFLGRREDPEVRACAAMALGRVGSARAQDALRKAGAEKEALVRNAVNRALRGGTA